MRIRRVKLERGRRYTRRIATQREIATAIAIADKLQLKLVGDQAKGITKKYTKTDLRFDPISDDPRFPDILRRVGF
jgi:hypothetical protein